MYIYLVIAVACIYIISMTIKWNKIPKYKYPYVVPLYILLWFDLLFSIAASFNFKIYYTKTGLIIAVSAFVLNVLVVAYCGYRYSKKKSSQLKGKSS
ncbi:hypothetical protein Alches_18540 [Alicyclobacillus hesperidum subsp. aegles]|nr:hypothetical protein SD51_13505 [Alicyclobacillus tengchongensis]GLG01814.1 hypothetical protein Alches_18540 [Alicyclobacillus hesperidum subsp. aegles]